MTSAKLKADMALPNQRLRHASPPRPNLRHSESTTSQHSASLPSTPRLAARQVGSPGPPSPRNTMSGSPRSVHSESHTTSLPFRNGPQTCPFEVGMAKFRRRIPYAVGTEPLEKAKAVTKKLRPEDEKKLTGDMRTLYDRILPTLKSEEKRAKFLEKLERLLNEEWPEQEIRVHVFGSSGNMLCTSDSDVDVCITTPMKELENVCNVAKALAKRGMARVVCRARAKVPIVKIWDPEYEIACDMNVNNTLALENTRMIKTYVQIDDRVRPLAMIIKHWTKQRVLNDAGLNGTLSSYTWICMIINFLQTRNPPILPSLQERLRKFPKEGIGKDGMIKAFADDMDRLKGFGSDNKESLGELLFAFFRHYAHDLDYENQVISIREGKLIPKRQKNWQYGQNNRICVEEPFNIDRNLGNTADETSARGIHMELRRAFPFLSDQLNLDKWCEPFHFPSEEKEKERERQIWEKPEPRPVHITERPLLPTSQGNRGRGSSSGRGGKGSNYGRPPQQQQHNPGRRASSGAALGSSMANGHCNPHRSRPSEAQTHDNVVQATIHQSLLRQYQILQMQEHQLLQQQQWTNQQALAQQTARQSHREHSSGATGHSAHVTQRDRISQSAPLLQEAFIYPYGYAISGLPLGTNTNPSSPRLSAAIPETRRSPQRGSTNGNSTYGAVRSQSQPAPRFVAPIPMFPMQDPRVQSIPLLNGRQSNRSSEESVEGLGLHLPLSPASMAPESVARKEYCGYGYSTDGSNVVSNPAPMVMMHPLQPIPAFTNFSRRTSHLSTDHLVHPHLNGSAEDDRSSSSLAQDRASSEDSSSTLLSASVPDSRAAQVFASRESAPLISSSVSTAPELAQAVLSTSASTSASDDRGFNTPATMSDTLSQEDFTVADVPEQQLYAQQLLELHNQAESLPSSREALMNGHGHDTIPPSNPSSQVRLEFPNSGQKSPSPRNSPGPQRQRAARRVSLIPTSGIPSIDVGKNVVETSLEDAAVLAPQLSPVLEMRTPSPTANRKSDVLKNLAFDQNSKAPPLDLRGPQPPPTPAPTQNKQKQAQHNTKAGESSKGSQRSKTQANGEWQQTSSRAGKPKAKNKKNQNASKSNGEVLPSNDSERKGG